MMILYRLLFTSILLLFYQCSCDGEIILVQCHDQLDYHGLLFRICEKSTHCSRLYYIDPDLDTSNFTHIGSGIKKLHDFDRFNHQMERVIMFDAYNMSIVATPTTDNSTTTTSIMTLITPKEKLLSTMLPPEWVTEIQIIFTELVVHSNLSSSISTTHHSCTESYDILAPENRLFVYSVLMSLQTFKLFISEEYSCSDPNEKLYMTGGGTFKCICSKGKSCNNESNFETIIIILMIFLLIGVSMWIVITFFSTISTSRQIQKLKYYNGSVDSS